MNKGIELEKRLVNGSDPKVKAIYQRYQANIEADLEIRTTKLYDLKKARYPRKPCDCRPRTPIEVSGVMIVKNEDKHIDNALSSLVPLVDEIIVLDTGSTDNTVEICQRYHMVTVYQEEIIPWDFAKARNRAIELAHGDVIFMLDGHEEVVGAPTSLGADSDSIGYVNLLDMTDDMTLLSDGYLPRVFPRRDTIRYEGSIQNDLFTSESLEERNLSLEVYHWGQGTERSQRSADMRESIRLETFQDYYRYCKLCVISEDWNELLVTHRKGLHLFNALPKDQRMRYGEFLLLPAIPLLVKEKWGGAIFSVCRFIANGNTSANSTYLSFCANFGGGEWALSIRNAKTLLSEFKDKPRRTPRECIRHKLYLEFITELLEYHINGS